MSLVKLIYASTASDIVASSHLHDILNTACVQNSQFGETGFLCANKKYFLQILEGDEKIVMQLFENIKQDYRHHDIQTITLDQIISPAFSAWSMGAVLDIDQHIDILTSTIGSAEFNPYQLSAKQAENLLKALAELKGIHTN